MFVIALANRHEHTTNQSVVPILPPIRGGIMAAFDWKKLSTADRVISIAGLIALIALFLPWYGFSSTYYSASVSGFGSGYGWLGGLLVVAAAGYLVLLRSGTNLPKTSIGPAVIVLGASAIGTVIVALRWLTLPRGSYGGVDGTGFSYGARIGIYIVLIAAVVELVFSFRLFKASGESLPWTK